MPSHAEGRPLSSKDRPPKLTADPPWPKLLIFQVGVALACIGVALSEDGFARATPKVYKSPPLFEIPILFQNESMPGPTRSS